MPRVRFEEIPETGRVWMFGADRPLSEQEEQALLEAVDAFLGSWAAHGTPLVCGRDWRHGRLLLIAVDEASVPPSGCSIDAMVHVLREMEQELGLSLVDNTPVWFLSEGEVQRVSRGEFKRLVAEGEVDRDTTVFDNTVTRIAEVRGGRWERPAADGWHGRAFFF
jgi:hypothetical protein